ncbi:MAG TPA: nitrite reductase (NAD(P)H) small subunit [Streptosporangiaceae bacterium]|nr:nitrite reductase (NAD(P)H) small subunit [Streptosporangiaceae bacterium]
MTVSVLSQTLPAGSLVATLPLAALEPEQGAAVLLRDGTSAAVFLLHNGSVHAVGNLDPCYGAPVVCHGVVGDRDGTPTVASPLGKQVFCLRTGRCLDDPQTWLPVFRTEVSGGVILLSSAGNRCETGPCPS